MRCSKTQKKHVYWPDWSEIKTLGEEGYSHPHPPPFYPLLGVGLKLFLEATQH